MNVLLEDILRHLSPQGQLEWEIAALKAANESLEAQLAEAVANTEHVLSGTDEPV
mgnify:CR=1 FL=1|jgi:hypothetical protein